MHGAQHDDVRNEQVLERQLSASQQVMMALGGAIGTGLFLASGLAVNVAGPAVILAYVIVAVIALLLGVALTEMAVAHPTAGAFGVYAGMYVSPFAGYAVRVSYWLMQVIATGGQLVAASIYMGYWFPSVPGALWVLAFAVALIFVNSRAVGELGRVEYWLVTIKVVAVAFFVALGVLVLAGGRDEPAVGMGNLTGHGGFMPFGITGVWLGCCFVIYSFIGVEIVGVTSGEASDPGRTIPRAMRRMVVGLSLIYVVTVTLLVALTPWNQLGIGESPFVSVLRRLAIPGAAGVMNAVVLLAALSSANANIYLIARTLFSLARAGFVPRRLGAVNGRGAPVAALLVSSAGLAVAVVVRAFWPQSAYVWFFGAALFGALFVWLMIFVTHIAFRAPRLPMASCIGAVSIAAILASTWWVSDLRATILAGGPWMLLLAIGYRLSRASVRRRAENTSRIIAVLIGLTAIASQASAPDRGHGGNGMTPGNGATETSRTTVFICLLR
jgi:AAT family amino acid transporter